MIALTQPASRSLAGASASAAPREAADATRHIPALDGIRGLAILLVLFHHLSILPGMASQGSLWQFIGELGVSGVDLFFVLSGFLITGILLDAKGEPNYFRNFYARRTLRIFPLYYAVVFVALVVLPALPHATAQRFGDTTDAWSYWLYLSNASMAYHGEFRHRVLDVTWSLAIEEQFYLAWPLVVWSVARRRTLAWVCVGLILLAVALRLALVLGGASWVAVFLLTPCRMDALAVGALIAVAARSRGGGVRRLVQPVKWAAPACAALLFVVLWQGAEYYRTPLGQVLGHTLVALLYGALLVVALQRGRRGTRVARVLSAGWLRTFGKYSYGLYLFHVPVFTVAHLALVGDGDGGDAGGGDAGGGLLGTLPGKLAFAAGATVLALALAWLSWHLFEKHFLAMKRYFPRRGGRGDEPASAPPADEHVWRGRTPRADLPAAPMPAPATADPARVPALDGVRGLAILLVMLTHFTLVQGGPLVDRVVGMVGRFGWSGVDLFFVLSGFLITGILLDNRDQPHYFRNFYARRALRIFPLYYVVIFFTTVVVPALPFAWTGHFPVSDVGRPLFWLYLSNFAVAFTPDGGNDLLGLTWSLAIEEQFYLVWPVLVLLLSRRALAWTCAGAIVVSVATRSALVLAGANRVYAYVLTPCRMDGLAIGCLVGLMLHGGGLGGGLVRARQLLLEVRWVGLLCILATLGIIGHHGTTGFVGGLGQSVGYTVIALFYACLLLLALGTPRDGIAARFFTLGFLRTLGKYSYALYLLHMGVARLVRAYVYDLDDFHALAGSRLPGQALFYALCFAPSLLLAWLSWHLLEKHFLALKDRFPARTRAVSAAAWEGGADGTSTSRAEDDEEEEEATTSTTASATGGSHP